MKDMPSTTFKLSPAWQIEQQEQALVVSGGADVRYQIDLENKAPSFFGGLRPGASFARGKLSGSDQRILEQLITAEVVVPVQQKGRKFHVTVLGDAAELQLSKRPAYAIVSGKTYDLAVLVRAHGTYAEFLERVAYQDILAPHLFVDMAFHHTLSVGPYVFPEETACVACLQGRLTKRWGDDPPPPKPHMQDMYRQVAADMVAAELERIAHDDTSLTNHTVAWDFQGRSATTNLLLKVPFCPICSNNKLDGNGRLALPWTKDESPAHTV